MVLGWLYLIWIFDLDTIGCLLGWAGGAGLELEGAGLGRPV